MFYGFLRAFIATCFVMISLYLWRSAYAYCDWGALALLPLSVVLFVGHRELLLNMHLAKQRVTWREDTWVMRWLSGRLSSTFWSLVVVTLTVPLLAWQSITMKPDRLPQLAVAFLMASLLYIWFQSVFRKHLQAPFHRNMAIHLATLAVLPLVVYAAWQSYYTDPISKDLLNAQLSEVPSVALDDLLRRDGWISQLMAPLQIYESGKLWLASRFPEQRWLAVLVSLDAALFAFVMGRTAAVVTDFLNINNIPAEK
tara:strand:+ start:743 stop:1507 length:765 start_codon:yes stop_codon:yes gene_type:complete